MRKHGLVAGFLLLAVSGCVRSDSPPAKAGMSFYQADVEILPGDQVLHCSLRLRFFPLKAGTEEAVFYLHRQFQVNSVSGPLVSGWIFDKASDSPNGFMPDGRPLRIRFSSALEAETGADLSFQYGGRITEWPEWSANVISQDWVEIGSYWPWFPYNPEHGPLTFDITVQVPEDFRVCSSVPEEREGRRWRFRQMRPVRSIVLAASPVLECRRFRKNDWSIAIHSLTLSERTLSLIRDDYFRILALYEGWFGAGESNTMVMIQSGRSRGGGYAREGLLVLGGLSDSTYPERREAYVRYLGHEVAHIWWSGASPLGWEDWLNEGFAEFSALLAVREFFGEKAFQRRLSMKRQQSERTASIWGFNRTDNSTPEKQAEIEALLYAKAPVLLADLESRLGWENFVAVSRELAAHAEKTTALLLRLIERNSGEEDALWFETQLKTR